MLYYNMLLWSHSLSLAILEDSGTKNNQRQLGIITNETAREGFDEA